MKSEKLETEEQLKSLSDTFELNFRGKFRQLLARQDVVGSFRLAKDGHTRQFPFI